MVYLRGMPRVTYGNFSLYEPCLNPLLDPAAEGLGLEVESPALGPSGGEGRAVYGKI